MMGSQWLYVGDLAIKRRKFCCCVLVSAIRRLGFGALPSVLSLR